MPAVRLDQLKASLVELGGFFARPVLFQRALLELLETYADLTYKPGDGVAAQRLVPSYHVPPIVLVQLEQSFYPLVQQNPDSALALADLLWQKENLEIRQVAAILLGQLPSSHLDHVLERLSSWSREEMDMVYLEELYRRGTNRLRREASIRHIELVSNWLTGPSPFLRKMGLSLLLPLVQDSSFQNLPAVFRLLDPLLHSPQPSLQPIYIDILTNLARISPGETRYFLQQQLSAGENPELVRLVHRSLSAFPIKDQAALRTVLPRQTREGEGNR